MTQNNPAKALHFSTGKAGLDQLPPEILFEWAQVFSYGEQKYFRDNWKKGNNWHEFYGSAFRHMLKWAMGEDDDPESNLPHLAHAIWNLAALRWYQIHGEGTDDRPISVPGYTVPAYNPPPQNIKEPQAGFTKTVKVVDTDLPINIWPERGLEQ